MRFTHSFIKTAQTPPRDEQSTSAALLEQAGFVAKLMAGVYTYLPLGWRVMQKIAGIIREEMNAIGGQELHMPALHPLENYVRTQREAIDVLFHLQGQSGKKMVLGQSHEEVIVPLVQRYIQSHKDLPLYLYQIQMKFRNELRAKSGILRGREFLMKDMYSFHTEEADLEAYYKIVTAAYQRIWKRAGIGEQTYRTYASGGTFSKYSHEFQTATPAGEDTVYLCQQCQTGINREIFNEVSTCPECSSTDLREIRSIEVGNIFKLKTRFSEAFGLTVTGPDGKVSPVTMGCYGIGLGRLMGTIIELNHDQAGMRWPAAVSPFIAHLVTLGRDQAVLDHGDAVYRELSEAGIDVLYDDRDESAGRKLRDADLIGVPIRLVVSQKTGERLEFTRRGTAEQKMYRLDEARQAINKLLP